MISSVSRSRDFTGMEEFSIFSSSISQAEYPNCIFGWLMVVMEGVVIMENSMLSNPTTIISFGTFRWKRFAARMTAAAKISESVKKAWGRVSAFKILHMAAYAIS